MITPLSLPQQAVQTIKAQASQPLFGACSQPDSILFAGVNQQNVNEAVKAGNKAVASKLMAQLSETALKENMVFSPASVWSFLVVLLNAAEGETKTELLEAMQLKAVADQGASTEQINLANKALNDAFVGLDKVTLENAYGVWVQKGHAFKPGFLDTLKVLEAGSGEFTPGNAQGINDWVGEKTHKMITEVLKDGDLKSDTAAVLAHALFMKAEWANKFPKEKTAVGEFNGTNGVSKPKMMKIEISDEVKLNYMETDEAQMVRLPYGTADDDGRQLSMSIFLPNKDKALADVYSALTGPAKHIKGASGLDQAIQQLSWARGAQPVGLLKMPVFKDEYKFDSLNDTLKAVGIKKVFLEGVANLKAMMAANTFLSKVLQKAVIDVNEEGTEAAAVTVGLISFESAMVSKPKPPFVMEVDRPFAYAIHDNNGQVLFVGTVNNVKDAS